MSKTAIFIQVHGRPGILEAELSDGTVGELHDVLAAKSITLDADTFIFIDEAEEHLVGDRRDPLRGLKHGCRIHVSHCRRITTTIHFLEKSAEREFSPGARVRAVKEWAVHEFKLNPKDAAEHVLQLCNSTERPASDTPLHELVRHQGSEGHHHGHGHHCVLCFDLVPDKRVEG